MSQLPPPMTLNEYCELPPKTDQIRDILAVLPIEVGTGLLEKLNEVLNARAPASFSDALGDLEAYLAALDDTRLIPFENQIALKAYVMQGWSEWRSNFHAIDAP